jgi:TATA box binding protein associated factor (TAF)
MPSRVLIPIHFIGVFAAPWSLLEPFLLTLDKLIDAGAFETIAPRQVKRLGLKSCQLVYDGLNKIIGWIPPKTVRYLSSRNPEAVADALARDMEYHLVEYKGQNQEASWFMRHSGRAMMTTSDIDQGLKTLNIEVRYLVVPVVSCSWHKFSLLFRKAQTTSGQAIYVDF